MKRIRFLIFVLLLGMTFSVKAENFNYYLSNSERNYEFVDKNNSKAINVKRGDYITFVAIIDNQDGVSDYQLSSGKLTIRWDEKFVSIEEVNGEYYNSSISDITGLTLGTVNKGSDKLSISDISSTGNLKPGKNKIAEFKFKVLNEATSSDTVISQMDGEDNLKCYNATEERTVNCGESLHTELKYTVAKSDINKLSMIKIDGQELEYFSEDKDTYDIEVDGNVTKVKIEGVKKDSKASITGDIGDQQLSYGINKFKIEVTSESGLKNTYNINVTREDIRSNDNSLKTLEIEEEYLEFEPSTLDYTINVENEIDKITISSSLNNPKAKYVNDNGNKQIKLNEGSNKVEIKILSEKGEERTYTLNINRAISSNNSLKTLTVDGQKVDLKENEFIYYYSVENDVDIVTIEATPSDPRSTVNVNDTYNLVVGENEINIKVKAPSGVEASYILNITRKKLLSKDSLLRSLKVKGYDFDFKQDETLYTLKIKDDVKELDITATPENSDATVTIEGNKNLENNSIIKIIVKAEDGTYTRYFINIEKSSGGLSPIVIIIIVLLVILAIILGIIVYRKKKQEQAEFKKIEEEAKQEEIKQETIINDKTTEENSIESNEEKPAETESDDNKKDV